MNLLTGRVERQTERWDLSRCSPPAAAAWQAARALWAAKQGGSELGKAVNSTLDSLTSMDDGEEYQAPNPNDPMKVGGVGWCGVGVLPSEGGSKQRGWQRGWHRG